MDTGEEKSYTISEIAEELGVSTTTVSRALSGKGRISKATRERVRDFVARNHYSPNLMARGLAVSRTYNLGLLMPEDFGATEVPFFGKCVGGICQIASEHNYDIIVAIQGTDSLAEVQRLVANHKIDGMIISRAEADSQVQDFLKEKNMPFVVIGPSEDPEVISVDNYNREASQELTGILLMKGLHRLALLGGSQAHLVSGSRRLGFLDAYKQQGVGMENALIIMDINNDSKMMQAVERVLEERVDGIVCMDDVICIKALNCLREKGIKIPEEVRLASLYDSGQLLYSVPAVTSLQFDAKELGRNACRALLRLLGEETEPEQRRLNYQVSLRESTK